MPAPQVVVVQLEPAGNGLALDARTARTWLALSAGATASISDTAPDTIGAAKLVPLPRSSESAVGIDWSEVAQNLDAIEAGRRPAR